VSPPAETEATARLSRVKCAAESVADVSAAGGDLGTLLEQGAWRATLRGVAVAGAPGSSDSSGGATAAVNVTAPRVDCKFEVCRDDVAHQGVGRLHH